MNLDEYKNIELAPSIRELYIQSQHWARHNENLIIATNGLILSGIAAIVTSAIKNGQALNEQYLLLLASISSIGIVLTLILNRRYLRSVERLVSYEALFGFHKKLNDSEQVALNQLKTGNPQWGECLVPFYLHERPKRAPESVVFFGAVHVLVLVVVLVLRCPYF